VRGLQSALGIRKLGFERWFERQLIESHVYFVTSFLCLILVLAVWLKMKCAKCGLQWTIS
jgi:hypothetical protein